MACLGICLPHEYRTKLVNWHFVDNEPKAETMPSLIRAQSDVGTRQHHRQPTLLKLGKRQKVLTKTLSVFEKLADKFAVKDDRLHQDIETASDTSPREGKVAPVVAPPAQGLPALAPLRLLPPQRENAVAPIRLSDPDDEEIRGVPKEVIQLMGGLSEKRYRQVFVDMTVATLKHRSEKSAAAARGAVDEIYQSIPVPPSSTAEYEEWDALSLYAGILKGGDLSQVHLWSIWAEAVGMWGLGSSSEVAGMRMHIAKLQAARQRLRRI